MSGPFGLERGMIKKDFTCNLEEIAPHTYILSAVPKPHSAFEVYAAMITPNHGLSWVKAIGDDIHTNPFGIEVRTKFDIMKSKLMSIYQTCEDMDFLMHDSIWNEPRDWMQALENKERILMSVWEAKHGSKMKDSLTSVALVATAKDTSTGYIVVEYEFDNHVAAKNELSSLEDEAL